MDPIDIIWPMLFYFVAVFLILVFAWLAVSALSKNDELRLAWRTKFGQEAQELAKRMDEMQAFDNMKMQVIHQFNQGERGAVMELFMTWKECNTVYEDPGVVTAMNAYLKRGGIVNMKIRDNKIHVTA